jgi:NAD-dependent deacetylase
VTQNVDRLHELAGSPSVIHLHGSVFRNKCAVCGIPMPEVSPDLDMPPRCESCGGLCRPDVVWFGEGLPQSEWRAAAAAAETADVVLSVGTSSTVYPAAELPVIARRAGAFVVQINPAPTPLDRIAHNLRGPAGEVLPALVEAWLSRP